MTRVMEVKLQLREGFSLLASFRKAQRVPPTDLPQVPAVSGAAGQALFEIDMGKKDGGNRDLRKTH